MIAYFDASALVKQYLAEDYSVQTEQFARQCEEVATCMITRTEVAAGLARAVRLGRISIAHGQLAGARFRSDWNDLVQITVDENLVEQADGLAWNAHLRGYDAVQLAAACAVRQLVPGVILASFNLDLRAAAIGLSFPVWPE